MRKHAGLLFLLITLLLIQTACKKGDTGNPGTNGTFILNGTGAPSVTTGSDGDFYLDTSTQILYGPKTAGVWGTGVLLKGNANVMIDTFRVTNADWQYPAFYYAGTAPGVSSGFMSRYFTHAEPALTQALLNTGIAQAYYTLAPDLNTNNWTPVPYSFISYGGYQYNYASETSIGKFTFYFYFSKISADPPDLQTYQIPDLRFKIMLLPGNLISEMTVKKPKPAKFADN